MCVRGQVLSLCYRRFQFSRETGIAYLFMALRFVNTDIAPDVSLPWGQANLKQKTKWLGVFWHKAIGPFHVTSFRCIKHFCLFWLGEKFQGAGFFWGLLRQRISRNNQRERYSPDVIRDK